MLELELPLRRPLNCRMEFPKLCAITFLLNIYTDSLSSVPKRCSLQSGVDDSKNFYRLHYRVWNARYCT